MNQGPERTYTLYNSGDSLIYHILTLKLDSIVYQDGTREVFNSQHTAELSPIPPEQTFKHHLAGIDIGAWMYKNARLSYEYFPFNTNIGFKGSVSVKVSPKSIEVWTNEDEYYDEQFLYMNIRGYSTWHATLGCNYYFFRPGSFRAITGLHYLVGAYKLSQVITDANYNVVETREIKKTLNGLLLNTYLYWSLNEYLSVNVGFDTPLIVNPQMRRVVFTAEFLLNF